MSGSAVRRHTRLSQVDRLVAIVAECPGESVSYLTYRMGNIRAVDVDALILAAGDRVRVEEKPFHSGSRRPRRYLYPVQGDVK